MKRDPKSRQYRSSEINQFSMSLTNEDKLNLLKLTRSMGVTTMTGVVRALIREKMANAILPVEIVPELKKGAKQHKKGSFAYYQSLSLDELMRS